MHVGFPIARMSFNAVCQIRESPHSQNLNFHVLWYRNYEDIISISSVFILPLLSDYVREGILNSLKIAGIYHFVEQLLLERRRPLSKINLYNSQIFASYVRKGTWHECISSFTSRLSSPTLPTVKEIKVSVSVTSTIKAFKPPDFRPATFPWVHYMHPRHDLIQLR